MKTLQFILIGAAFMALVAYIQINYFGSEGEVKEVRSGVAGADIGGPFELVNGEGETVTDADFTGQYKLIYFGFTFCPAICPTELQKITESYGSLPESLQNKITPIFISIDPERDTPDVVGEYVAMFHEDMVGLTGSIKQIQQVKDAYRVYASKVQTDEMSEYTMDHSSYIYLMSPTDDLMAIYKISDPAETIAEDLKQQIAQ